MFQMIKKMAYNTWEKIKKFFKDSEIIFAARMSVLAGVIYAGLTAVDWNQIMALNFVDGISKGEMIEASKYIVLGILMEYLRRRRASDL